jgi:hypothetical protein
MSKYNNLLSELDEKTIDMISDDMPQFTDNNLNNIKEKYKMRTINKKNNYKKIVIRSLSTAACVCAIFVGIVNTNTAFAAQLLDIPVIGTITNLVTVNKLALYDKYRDINIDIPAVEGLKDATAEEKINNILKERSIAVHDKAVENAEKIKEESEKVGFITSIPETVSQNYTLIRNVDNILSFKVVTTEIGASGHETADFYNIDLENSKLLNMNDLFKRDYDYVSVINEEIVRLMEEGIEKEEAGYFVEYFKTIDDNTNFYINNNNKLVIVFNEYEISAGYMGMPEFIIDTTLFKDNISEFVYLK